MKDILQQAIMGMIRGPGGLLMQFYWLGVNDTATNNRHSWSSNHTGSCKVHKPAMEK
jgi:hypothetical protein